MSTSRLPLTADAASLRPVGVRAGAMVMGTPSPFAWVGGETAAPAVDVAVRMASRLGGFCYRFCHFYRFGFWRSRVTGGDWHAP